MISLILRGAGFGFTAGTVPGPLHTYLMNETLLQGFRRSFIIVLSPLLSDIPIILLMILVLDNVSDGVIRALEIFGGLFVLYLARNAWKQSQEETLLKPSEASSPRFAMWQALLVNWLNPNPYIFWGTVLGPLLLEGLEKSIWHGAAFLLAFYGVFLGVMTIVGLTFHYARGLDERWLRGMLRCSVVILTFFGLRFIYQGIVG
jgi:threonine/homoserine/homoserine lactone efflux protein